MEFGGLKEAFDGIIYQDSSNTWDNNPFAIIRNSQFQQLANSLISTKKAVRTGTKLILNEPDSHIERKRWLYDFVRSVGERKVEEMIAYQR